MSDVRREVLKVNTKRALMCAVLLALAVAASAQTAVAADDYVVVQASTAYELQMTVNSYLRKGYCLYGPVHVLQTQDVAGRINTTTFYQVVISIKRPTGV